MPTYTFKCEKCEHVRDYILKIANMDDPLTYNCESCGAVALKRSYSEISHAFMSSEALGRRKPDADWRNYLSAVKRKNPGANITTD